MSMNENPIRPPAVAGSFYPDDPAELRTLITKYLKLANETQLGGEIKALVVPHAGYIYSGPIAAYGYKVLAEQIRSKNKKSIKRAILLGPSHYARFTGACESGHRFWQTPLGIANVYQRKNSTANTITLIGTYTEAHEQEHCLEVQVPFLQQVFGDKIEIWPILCGQVDPAALAQEVESEIDDSTIVIASSDLSHYQSYDKARTIDRIANESVPALDIKRFESEGDACGKMAILTLMHIAKAKGWQGKLLDYRNSGDTAGPKSRVVGYGAYAFYEVK